MLRRLAGPVLLGACAGVTPQPEPVGVPVVVEESGVVPCVNPVFRGTSGPFERRQIDVPLPEVHWTWAGGVTAADLDGDGLLDVLVPVEPGMGLYRGLPGGTFEDVSFGVFGAGFDLSYASGTSVSDYDGDGDLDVYVMRITGEPGPEGGTYGANRLLRNEGGLVFTDVTDAAGVSACGVHHRDPTRTGCWRTMTSSWADYDGDDDLDLYVGNYGYVDETPGTEQTDMQPAEPDFLYRNEGDGTFADLSSMLPLEVHDGYTYAGGFLDLDADADPDLYTVNDFGNCWPNRVMWNEGGTLVWNGTPSASACPGTSGGDPRGLEKSMTGMGLGVGDLNGDALPDLAIPVWAATAEGGPMALLESAADLGIWIDVAQATGFVATPDRDQRVGWGTEVGDVDNDGDLDLVSQYGHLENENPVWENPTQQSDALYLNEPSGSGYTFVDVAPAWGVHDPWQTRGVVLADVNRDGWLDLAKRSLTGDNALYLSRCGEEAWLSVELRQPGANTRAVGARVTAISGGRSQVRWVFAGGTGYASSPPPELHFGLGAADAIDWLVVHWPDGEETVLADVESRQRVTITRE